MSFINCNVPPIKVYVRKEFFYDQRRNHGDYYYAMLLGVRSIPNRALGFHVLTEEGVVWWNLPIHALCWKPCPRQELNELELWNAFSSTITATEFFYLQGRRAYYRSRSGDARERGGEYVCTFDWAGGDKEIDLSLAETADEHKCAHFLRLDNGNFALQPNNRIRFEDPSFVTKPFPEKPDFKVNTHIWNSEQGWKTEDSDRFHYETIEEKPWMVGHTMKPDDMSHL